MKKLIKSAMLTLAGAFLLVSFSTLNDSKPVRVNESQVAWKGHKVTGSHSGTIALKSGNLEFKNDKLTGGDFVIDMTTINTTDLEGGKKDNLDGHLKSDDFFGVTNFPTASLKITKVSPHGKDSYSVSGDMTIKGNTNPVSFAMIVKEGKATASFKSR